MEETCRPALSTQVRFVCLEIFKSFWMFISVCLTDMLEIPIYLSALKHFCYFNSKDEPEEDIRSFGKVFVI